MMPKPKPTPEQEARIRKLIAEGVSEEKISKRTGVNRYQIRMLIYNGVPRRKRSVEPEPNVVVCAKIYARTPRGAQLRATEGDVADLDLSPDIAELARKIREEGFDAERYGHHEPWTDEECERRAAAGTKSEPFRWPETSIHFYRQ